MDTGVFTDRKDAGTRLAKKLESYRGTNAVIIALPRGGVVVASEIAHSLALPLDIFSVRKIGHPASPEYAIGAVDERGGTLMNEAETATLPEEWLKKEIDMQSAEAKRRATLYRGEQSPIQLAGKIVIIVDDGLATGLTMRLTVRSIRTQKPEKIIVAVAVAPREAIHDVIQAGADQVITLLPPEAFAGAVGAHYVNFEQVEDADVITLLHI